MKKDQTIRVSVFFHPSSFIPHPFRHSPVGGETGGGLTDLKV